MSSSIINGVTSSNVLKRVLVDADGHLQVDVQSGGTTEFLNDANYDSSTAKGSVAMGLDSDNNDLQFIAVDANGHLQVDVLSGGGNTNTEVTHDAALGATPTSQKGTILAAFAGTPSVTANDACLLACTTTGALKVDNSNLTTLAGAVSGSQMQVDIVTSALPSGAATSAAQSTGNTSLATIAGAVSDTHMQVDILTSALPSGAATSTAQSTANGYLSTIATEITTADTSLGTIAGAVSDSQMQVDIVSSATLAVTNSGLTDLAAAIGTDGSDSVTSTMAVGGTDGSSLQALSVNSSGVLNTKFADVTSGTFTLTDGITANTGAGGVTLPADGSAGLDIRGKSGKLTIFGSISGYTNSGGDGYNNIQLVGSLSSSTLNSTFTDLSSTFEIYVDSDGKFGQTIDILMPYLKFNTVNAQGSTRTLTLNYVYN